jgi:hypothetical protein
MTKKTGLPNPLKRRILGFALTSLVLVCFMGLVGLWPFSFCAPNNAVLLENGGVEFSSPAVIYDVDTLTTSEKSFLADSISTIRLRICPDTAGSSSRFRPAWLLSLRYGHRERVLIAQWQAHLFVGTVRSGEHAGSSTVAEKKELDARNAFGLEQILDVVIVTGPPGTTLFVNGERKAFAGGYRMFDGTEAGRQHLQAGGSVIGKYTWRGKLYELSMYKGDVSRKLTKQESATAGSPPGPLAEAPQPFMRFAFENNGPFVRNSAGARHTLYVAPNFPVSTDQVLVPIWVDFVKNTEYVSDMAVNFAGFIPFGYFFAGFFMLLFPKRKGNAILGAVAGGFCLSLTIELLQVLLPLRSSQMSDLIFNTLGTVAGALLSALLSRREKTA